MIDPGTLSILEDKLATAPESALRLMRRSYSHDLDLDGAQRVLGFARQALASPVASREPGPAAAPGGFQVDDAIRDDRVVIDPGSRKFEEQPDLLNWVSTGIGYWAEGEFRKKAPLRRHQSTSDFVYQMPSRPATRVALFSDFGTGLYHSQYIAKHIRDAMPDCAIHLGDVYYSGRPSDFSECFTPFVEPFLDRFPFYAMNGNHEMMSGGFSYFGFLDDKRRRNPHLQEQEASYFALQTDVFQIIALDTDYEDDGSHRDDARCLWLEKRLVEGRRRGLINILLTGDEPYGLGAVKPTSLYTHDLARYILPGMIDLWFWGNTHYCALYKRTSPAPFVGSCIGHGGYPYQTIRRAEVDTRHAVTELEWLEEGTRFPESSGIRPDMGSNGFVMMTIGQDRSVVLEYIDWLRRPRHTARLVQADDKRSVLFRG